MQKKTLIWSLILGLTLAATASAQLPTAIVVGKISHLEDTAKHKAMKVEARPIDLEAPAIDLEAPVTDSVSYLLQRTSPSEGGLFLGKLPPGMYSIEATCGDKFSSEIVTLEENQLVEVELDFHPPPAEPTGWGLQKTDDGGLLVGDTKLTFGPQFLDLREKLEDQPPSASAELQIVAMSGDGNPSRVSVDAKGICAEGFTTFDPATAAFRSRLRCADVTARPSGS